MYVGHNNSAVFQDIAFAFVNEASDTSRGFPIVAAWMPVWASISHTGNSPHNHFHMQKWMQVFTKSAQYYCPILAKTGMCW